MENSKDKIFLPNFLNTIIKHFVTQNKSRNKNKNVFHKNKKEVWGVKLQKRAEIKVVERLHYEAIN